MMGVTISCAVDPTQRKNRFWNRRIFLVASTGTKSRVLSCEILVGDCGYGSESVELTVAAPVKFPVRFEISYDHGIGLKLFNPLKVRGEKGHGPQIPSVYSKLDKWQSY